VRDPGFWVFIDLQGPGGELLSCRGCENPPVVGEVGESRGSAQIPSTDRDGSALLPGTYQFRVNVVPLLNPNSDSDSSVTTADVIAALRSTPGGDVEHLLDLNFIYLPDIPLDAEIAATTPEFAELLGLIDLALAPLGIRIGESWHQDLDRSEFTHLSSWEEAGELLQTSAQLGRPRALNVYCVGLFDGDLNLVGGLSGGIPGPVVNGMPDSGIIIRIAPSYPNYLPAYAALFAHEIGHYVGFYHTTEADLEDEDPISDTPRCDEPDLQACPDWNHYMFPLIHPDMNTWSPAQIGISPTHPMIRAVPAPGAHSASASVLASSDLRAIPNPFSGSVDIVGAPAWSRAEIFDITGRRLRALVDGASTWDGLDHRGRRVPAGTYLIRIHAEGAARTLRVVRVR
jgi:hypothetical protein